MIHTYSDKEEKMFRTLYPELTNFEMFSPGTLYHSVVIEVFIKQLEGPAVESLRRCMVAWQENQIQRMSPEWDSLIRFN